MAVTVKRPYSRASWTRACVGARVDVASAWYDARAVSARPDQASSARYRTCAVWKAMKMPKKPQLSVYTFFLYPSAASFSAASNAMRSIFCGAESQALGKWTHECGVT